MCDMWVGMCVVEWCVCACVHACMHGCVHACMHACMYVVEWCVCICVYMYILILEINIQYIFNCAIIRSFKNIFV